MEHPEYIGVIGAGECSETIYELAMELGNEIGEKGWSLVCGGLKGVMEGAARGCYEAGGTTIGILPGMDRRSANQYIRIAIPTGLGDGRNLLVVRASDILVAVAGSYGTLSEISLALKIGRPVIGIETWKDIPGVRYVKDVKEAIKVISEVTKV
ncbi:MAG: TIGR00725 family protein, partial [Deltaproteobacteria bacterium]|nr:TIGR00725 family protein [Deltaproteobacteria bacterium]